MIFWRNFGETFPHFQDMVNTRKKDGSRKAPSLLCLMWCERRDLNSHGLLPTRS